MRKEIDQELNENLFHDFKLLLKMKSNPSTKAEMMPWLFKQDPDGQRVVKITKQALQTFCNNNFKSKNGIQRAHVGKIKDTYKTMLDDATL